MTESTSTSPALQTALAYYHAWTSHDIDKAMTCIAGNIVCLAPSGRLEGAGAFRGFMGPFRADPHRLEADRRLRRQREGRCHV